MREALKSTHPIAQLAVLILLGFLAMTLLVGIYTSIIWALGMDISAMTNLASVTDPFGLEATSLKVLQLAQAVGLFITPYAVYRWYLSQETYSIGIPKSRLNMLLVFSLSILGALPMINFLADWNSGLSLPTGLEGIQAWIEQTEADAMNLIEVFLVMENPWHLSLNLFLIALVPAISEELFFRGTLQPLLLKRIHNPHVAIWLTAFLFSFFHMQFFGFIPRMLLGAVLGYAAHWSGSMALPMVGHFINNGVAVSLAYFVGLDVLDEAVESLGANEGEVLIAALSACTLAAGMYYLNHKSRLQEKSL